MKTYTWELVGALCTALAASFGALQGGSDLKGAIYAGCATFCVAVAGLVKARNAPVPER